MELDVIKIIESLIVFAIYVIVRLLSYKIIEKTLDDRLIQNSRGIIIKRAVKLTFLVISIAFISLIWGVKQSDLGVLIGSVLTVVGVAMFAQWSLLSNITSSVIIFFNHSVKINDSITIMEAKDYVIEGKVTNIGLFFITLETADAEEITLPNNVFIQKSIKKRINLQKEDS